MLAVGLRYLNGWAMATHPADRERPEWPPHPDRVLMALAAAHFETCDEPPSREQRVERAALEWLAGLARAGVEGWPTLLVSPASQRETVTTFVPVNDSASPLKGPKKNERALMPAGALAIGRDRQPRQFPVAIPTDPVVFLLWERADPPPDLRPGLVSLCAKVTSVGHSASLVQAWIEEEVDGAQGSRGAHRRLVPVAGPARYRLRVPTADRLAELRERHAEGQRPRSGLWSGYGEERPGSPPARFPSGPFSPELVVLRRVTEGPRLGRVGDEPALGLESTLLLTRTLRDTVLSRCPEPVPEWVSGHAADGSASRRPHLAFLPLAHVGRERADGHLLGLALALPASVPDAERARALGPVLFDPLGRGHRLELRMGRAGRWVVELEERAERPYTLRPEPWTAAPPAAGARRWASVTPIGLDRHPKGADRWREIEATIAGAVTRLGLPAPTELIAGPVSLFPGVPHVRRFPNLERRGDGGRVFHTHAVVTFAEPVCGPILLGAGRYLGYGLMRPLPLGGGDVDAAS